MSSSSVRHTPFVSLSSDEAIYRQREKWREFPTLAVDFEGEFNLHVYGEHLCLVQIWDGEGFFVIDPLSPDVTKQGLEAFFSLESEKLWFDVQGDASLLYKQYGLKIRHPVDLRAIGMVLGSSGTLLSLEEEYLGIESETNKKKNQTSNWMRRPLSPELMEYALDDVRYLFQLRDALMEKAKEKKLLKEAESAAAKAALFRQPKPPWVHAAPWNRLSPKEKICVKRIFIAREGIAKRFNVPSSSVMSKKQIASLSLDPPSSFGELEKRLSNENERFRSLLAEKIWKEMAEAEREFLSR